MGASSATHPPAPSDGSRLPEGGADVHDRYPPRVIALSVGSTLLSNALGLLVFLFLGLPLALVYLLLVVASIVMSMALRCRFCWYYGKRCSACFGLVAARFFRQGQTEDFPASRNMLPVAVVSFGVMLLPAAACVYLLATDFSTTYIVLTLAYLLGAIAPGFAFRERLVCRRCRQGEIGCPAYDRMRGTGPTTERG